ncbi:sensor histidine kinase [Actinacidiphila sp. SB3-2]
MNHVNRIHALLDPLRRTVTYTRWLHMMIGSVVALVFAMVWPGLAPSSPVLFLWLLVMPVPLLVALAMLPGMRLAEGLQARLMLLPGKHARRPGPSARGLPADGLRDGREGEQGPGRPAGGLPEREIAAAPSASWADRRRTAVWMVLRLQVGCLVTAVSIQPPTLTFALVSAGLTGRSRVDSLIPVPGGGWWYLLLAPLPTAAMLAVAVLAGNGMTAAAHRLLGPSPAERLAALEEHTERMAERSRLAGEMHDSIGHALTLSVVQAGAARAAGSPEFTERALAAIEESGRHALEDLERVLRLLRDDAPRPSRRPGLDEVERLLESARAAGAPVTAELEGLSAHRERIPPPVSREGYRIVQEALTNVLRHAGPVRVTVRIACEERDLALEIRNALPWERQDGTPTPHTTSAGPGPSPGPDPDLNSDLNSGPGPRGTGSGSGSGTGSGLRGIRERAALLGGHAEAGPCDGEWRVSARLPCGARPRAPRRPRRPRLTGAA